VALVTIGTYRNTVEAELARGLLESEGIEARVLDAHTNALRDIALAVGARLVVDAEHAERARELLQKAASASVRDDPEDGPQCPRCKDRYAYEETSLLATVLRWLRRRATATTHWRCRKCDFTWEMASPASPHGPYR
jgi:hypothetical protein